MTPAEPPPARRAWLRRALPITWIVALSFLTAPWIGTGLGLAGLDPSWGLGISLGAYRHLQFGKDIVFTFGPLGFLPFLRFDYVELWAASAVASVVTNVVFFASVALLLSTACARPRHWALTGAFFLLPVAWPDQMTANLLIIVILLQVALTSRRRRLSLVAAAGAGAAMAVALMVRGTALPVSAVVLAMAVGFFAFEGRRGEVAGLFGGLLVTFTVAWVGVGQRLENIPAYLRSAFEIISGYSRSMGVIERATVNFLPGQVWFAAGGVMLFGLTMVAAMLRRDRALVYLVGLCLPVVFVLFKDAFVRIGPRHMYYYTGLGICAALVVVQASRGPAPRVPRVRVVVPGTVVGLVALLSLGSPMVAMGVMQPPAPPFPWLTLGDRLATYPAALRLLTSVPDQVERARLAVPEALHDYHLPDATVTSLRQGTVDVVPWEIGMVKTYDLRWKPRVVLQSYSAYTPYLDHLDAARYTTDGPDRVVYQNDFLDDRCAPFDEPEFFRTVLERYQVESRVDAVLVLRRRTTVAPASAVDLGTFRSGFGEWTLVPSSPTPNPVYAAIDVRLSPVGRVLDLAFQPPQAHLVLLNSHGQTITCRLLPTAADGILASEFIGWIGDTEALFNHAPTAYGITAIKVTTLGASAYEPEVSTRFFSQGNQ